MIARLLRYYPCYRIGLTIEETQMYPFSKQESPRFPSHEINRLWLEIQAGGKTISIPGIELLVAASDTVKTAVNKFGSGEINPKITSGQDWLRTAGHLSKYISKESRRSNDLWYPETYTVYTSKVNLMKFKNGDAYVVFEQGNDSYKQITNELLKIPGIESHMEFIDLVNEFCLVLTSRENDRIPPLHLNQTHSQLAKALLSRIAGKPYPDQFKPSEKLLDTILMLVIGVEGSRNNVTYLTWILLLDLIAGNHTYGEASRAFSWFNAFVSPAGYEWDDFENNGHPGKDPMSATSTGKGSLRDRATLISCAREYPKDIPKIMQALLEQPQHHRVARREISLLVTWLKIYFNNDPTILSDVKSKKNVLQIVRNTLQARMGNAYLSKNPAQAYLPANTRGFLHSSPLLKHFEHDTFVFTTWHFATDSDDAKRNKHYHRIDFPCKLIPEYVRLGQSKTIYHNGKEVEASSKVVVHPKRQDAIIRKIRTGFSYASLGDGITFDWPNVYVNVNGERRKLNPGFAQSYFQLYNAFQQWSLRFFNYDALANSINLKTILQRVKAYDYWGGCTQFILSNLQWRMYDGGISAYIDKQQIESLLQQVNKNGYTTPSDEKRQDYISNLLRALHFEIDPIMENGFRYCANERVCLPDPEHALEVLNELALVYEIPNNHIWKTIRKHWAYKSFPSQFFAAFSLDEELTPCPHCYKKDNKVNSQEMKTPFDAVLCFADKNDQFHLIGSECHDKDESVEAMFVSEARYHKFNVCEECWMVDATKELQQAKESDQKHHKVGEVDKVDKVVVHESQDEESSSSEEESEGALTMSLDISDYDVEVENPSNNNKSLLECSF